MSFERRRGPGPGNSDPLLRSATRGPFDHFEICANSNLKVIERTTCCATRYYATTDPLSGLGAPSFQPQILEEAGELQKPLNQKVCSNSSEAVDFVLRFVLLINSKFKIHTFNNYYKSQCKII
jgi:hypothetical protein